jgi:hypothetical protein
VVVVQHREENDPADKRYDEHGGNEWATLTGTVRGLRVKLVSQTVSKKSKDSYRREEIHSHERHRVWWDGEQSVNDVRFPAQELNLHELTVHPHRCSQVP